ncbi:acyl-[acyl-carrier-protein] thioesterase [Ilumatobacter nonamiensis]|uniref:acyl-[acyl-carrier-protein] thioesterase n=1 Tax=Ilumatobacter nonamiensis TaxID=467093 RepID=UPI000347A0E4|nr:acyl-ACP thioesterase domain-containing protein [Ilumatobacter nonamiensis]
MPSAAPAIELLDEPDDGRRFTIPVRVRLGDVDRMGRMRFDAIARVLQDVATDDASDAGLDRRFGWLVRRTMIESRVPAGLGESIEATTWCTGIGRSWAERRSRIVGDRGAMIDAVSLWVQVDPSTARPTRIESDFTDAYGTASGGRVVSSRLALPSTPEGSQPGAPWHVRRTDLDPFGHVNNAATWAFLEEAAELDESARVGRAELEYLRPLERNGDDVEIVVDRSNSTTTAWLTSGDETLAAARWAHRA